MPRPLWAWDRVWQRLGFRRRTDRPAATGRRRLRGIHRRPQFEALEPRLALTGDLEAVADTYRIAYGTALVSYDSAGGVLANDARGAAPGAEAELVSATAGGALEFHADGSFSYAPYAGFIGWDTFSYRLTDPEQPSEPTTVSILVGLDFTVEPVTASEADGALTYTITLDTPIPQALAVDWRVGGDSATWGDDFFVGTWVEGYWVEGYTDPETGAWVDGYEVPGYWHNTEAEGGTLYFAPGQLTQTVTLALVDDAHREARERFYLALDLETDAQPHWATIVDNEPVVLTVSPAPVSELNRQLTLTFALNGPADAPVSFSWRPVAVTATAGSDFAALGPQSVTIHPGAASHSVVLPNFVVDDALNEGPETLELRIENLVGAVGGYSVLATIGDDDRPLLAVSAPVASETAGTLRFVASLSRPTNVPVSFRWSTVDGSARAAADYLAVTDRLVTLAAGQTQAFLDVPLVDNQLFEHSEQFTLHLSELVNVAYAGLPPQATIFDNEPLPFVSLGNAVVHEGAGTATLLVTLSQAADHEVQVRWLPRGGTAVRQVDGQPGDWEHPGYWVESDWVPEQYDEWGNLIGGGYWGYREWQDGGWVVFAPGETVRSLHVGLIDDPDQEIDESFFVDLAESPQVPIAVATGVVLLWDNDRPRVSLDDVALAEALGTGSLLVRVSYASELPIQVDWAAQNGTAQAGLDWTFGYWDGGYYEEGYLFYGYLDFWGNWIDETWVSAASYDPSTTLAHVRQDRWIEPYWVDINHWGQLQFEPGETQKVLTVRIVDDQLDEDDETFTVGLSNATNAYAQNDPATVTILDNDLPPQLYVGDITVSETVGLARFTVFLTNASGLPVTVQYRTEDLSAVSGVDFAGFTAPQTLSFAPGESFRVIEVPILDDALRQGTRQFRLRLSEPTGATLLDGEALATLRDDETPTVWVTSQGAALEGAPALFTVSVVGSLSQPITLQYFTAHGTAVGSATGGDYVPQALTSLTLTAAQPTRTISVQTRQDPISELVEGFRLYVSTPANAYLATPDIWAPIVDDDPLPRVTLGDVVVDEASGYVYLTVSSDRPSERGAYVTWQTRDGSAVFGVDYSHASADWAPPEYDEWGHEIAPGYWYAYGSLYLGSGGSQTIALALINDDLPEAAETFEVRLVDAGQVEILDGSATVTIETNDLPTFSTSSSAADEGYGFLSFGVYLDRPAEALVGVYWELITETAAYGHDWVYGQWVDGVWQDEPGIHGGYLEFPYGSQGQTITVRLLDDSFAEADETLRLRLHSPPFGLVGTAEATGTILDDDPPTLTITSSATVQESQGYVELTLTLGAPSGRTIELDWEAVETNPPSARLGSDFVNPALPAQRRVTFLPGQWTRTLRVDLVDDGLAEPAEQFLVRLTPVEPRAVQLASTEAIVMIAGHQATNLPPSLTVPGPQVLAEDGQLAFGSASGNVLSVADPDAGQNHLRLTLVAQGGSLTLSSNAGLQFDQGDGLSDALVDVRGSLSDLNTALDGLQFIPSRDHSGAASIALTVNDLGNSGTGGPRFHSDTISINVQPINDAPQLASDHLTVARDLVEDVALVDNPGYLLRDLLGDLVTSDGLVDPDPHPLRGVALFTAEGDAAGLWEYSTNDGSNWHELTFGEGQCLPLAADNLTRLRFRPLLNASGTASLAWWAWDQTDGVPAGDLAYRPEDRGGATAYSERSGGFRVDVLPLNDPPELQFTSFELPSFVHGRTTTNNGEFAIRELWSQAEATVRDADEIDPHLTMGIALLAAPSEHLGTPIGRWQFQLAGCTAWEWVDYDGALSSQSARLLGPQDRLRFVADPDYLGRVQDAIRFVAWDMSAETRGGRADLASHDAVSPFSDPDQIATASIQVQRGLALSVVGQPTTVAEDTGTLTFSIIVTHAFEAPTWIALRAEPAAHHGATLMGDAADFAPRALPSPDNQFDPFLVLLPAGQLQAGLQIDIVDDSTDEWDESFQLVFDVPSAALEHTDVPAEGLTVTILDDDAAPRVEILPGVGAERDGYVEFVVRLSHVTEKPTAVHWATVDWADATAFALDDYFPAEGNLDFTGGAVEQTIRVPLRGDTLLEDLPERFRVALSGVSNLELAGSGLAEGTIYDGQGLPRITVSDAFASIYDATLVYNVYLSRPADAPVTVQWSLSGPPGSTAAIPLNALPPSRTLTFSPGQTRQRLALPLSFTPARGLQRYDLTLTTTDTAVVLGDAQAIGWVSDADHPRMRVREAQVTPGTMAGTRKLAIGLSAPFRGDPGSPYYQAAATEVAVNIIAGNQTQTQLLAFYDDLNNGQPAEQFAIFDNLEIPQPETQIQVTITVRGWCPATQTFVVDLPSPQSEDEPQQPEDECDCGCDCCADAEQGHAQIDAQTGRLALTLPDVVGLPINYNSIHTMPTVLGRPGTLTTGVDKIGAGTTRAIPPAAVTTWLTVDDDASATRALHFRTDGLASDTVRFVGLADFRPTDGTKSYAWKLAIEEDYGGNSLTRLLSGRTVLVDRTAGPLGAGWDLGLNRLIVESDRVILLRGNATTASYEYAANTGEYVRPAGEAARLRIAAGGFELLHHDGATESFDASGRLSSKVDRDGNRTQYEYDAQARLVRIVDPWSRATVLTYDSDGRLAALSDALGRTVAFNYADGRLSSVRLPDPDGPGPQLPATLIFGYDSEGRLVSQSDSAGRQTTYTYDEFHAVQSAAGADGRATDYQATQTAGLRGQGTAATPAYLVDITRAEGWVRDGHRPGTVVTVDRFGHRTGRQDVLGVVRHTERDAEGHLVREWTESVEDGRSTPAVRYEYEGGNLTKKVYEADNSEETWAYDAQNRVVEHVARPRTADEPGQVTRTQYEHAAGLLRITTLRIHGTEDLTPATQGDDPWDAMSLEEYSDGTGDLPAGLLLRTVDADPDGYGPLPATETRYTYYTAAEADPAFRGRIKSVSHVYATPTGPVTATRHVAYAWRSAATGQRVGWRETETDPLGRLTVSDYDLLDRLVRIERPDPDAAGPLPSPVAEYVYDLGGRRVQVTEYGQTTQFTYNALGQLVSQTELDPDAEGPLSARTTTYEYNSHGQQTRRTDPTGRVTQYDYEDGLLMQQIETDPDGPQGPATAAVTSFTYDARGRKLSATNPLGETTTYKYDWLGQLVRETGPDPDGGGPRAAAVTHYTYDAEGRPTRVARVRGNLDPMGGPLPGDEPDEVSATTYFADGSVHERVEPSGLATVSSYDRAGRLIQVAGPQGTTRHEYDLLDRRTHVHRVAGLWDGLADRPPGDPDDLVERTLYDGLGRVVGTELLAGGVVLSTESTTYDLVGRRESSVDALGQETRYRYDQLDRLTDVITVVGEFEATFDPVTGDLLPGSDDLVTSTRYNERGQVTAEIDARRFATRFSYDARGRQIRVERPDPDGTGPLAAPVIEFDYEDASDLVLREVDPRGFETRYVYDPLGRRIETHYVLGVWDGASHRPALDPADLVESAAYDSLGRLVRQVDRLGRETRSLYELAGRRQVTVLVVGQFDPETAGQANPEQDDLRTVTESDAWGRVVQVAQFDAADPAGLPLVTTYAYGDFGLTDVVGPLGTTTFGYNSRGQQEFVSRPAGRLTNPNGATLTTWTAYDELHPDRRLADTDEAGRRTRYEYDAWGRVSRQIAVVGLDDHLAAPEDPRDRVTAFEYDPLGRLVRQVEPDPDGIGPQASQETLYRYGRQGLVASMIQVIGSFDPLTAGAESNDRVTTYAYDAAGNRTALTDPSGNTTAWEYDALGRMVRETNSLGHQRLFAYDAAGNLQGQTDRLGRATEYVADRFGRRTAETWLDPAGDPLRTIRWTFDPQGRLVELADPDGRLVYAYDRLDRLSGVSTAGTPGLPTVELALTYDPFGRLARRAATIDGVLDFETQYAYDAAGRTTRIVQQAQSPAGDQTAHGVAYKGVDLAYAALGQLAELKRFAAPDAIQPVVRSTLAYEGSSGGAGRLIGLTHAAQDAAWARYGWSYDEAGRIVQFTNAVRPAEDAAYGYDATGQLTSADYAAGPDEAFQYDLTGNRQGSGSQLGSQNRLLADATATYANDAEGNRTARIDAASGERQHYVWDHRNRLVRVEVRDAQDALLRAVDYRYDPLNRRLSRTLTEGTDPPRHERYVYDEGQQRALALTAEGDGPAGLAIRYLYGPAVDQILAEERVAAGGGAGSVLWPLTDHLHTVRDVVDAGGVVRVHLRYNAFGKLLGAVDGQGAPLAAAEVQALTSLFYTAKPRDFVTNLQEHWHRWYDPAAGRWLSEDPLGFAAGDENLYRYVSNRPLQLSDPDGLQPPGQPLVLNGTWDTIADDHTFPDFKSRKDPGFEFNVRVRYGANIPGTRLWRPPGETRTPVVLQLNEVSVSYYTRQDSGWKVTNVKQFNLDAWNYASAQLPAGFRDTIEMAEPDSSTLQSNIVFATINRTVKWSYASLVPRGSDGAYFHNIAESSPEYAAFNDPKNALHPDLAVGKSTVVYLSAYIPALECLPEKLREPIDKALPELKLPTPPKGKPRVYRYVEALSIDNWHGKPRHFQVLDFPWRGNVAVPLGRKR